MISDSLETIALAVAQERSPDVVLARIVEGLAREPGTALARIWLTGPGDRCATCPMRPVCRDQTRCLHLSASAGASSVRPGEEWSGLDGPHARIPFGLDAKVSHVGTSGEAVLLNAVTGEHGWALRPEWVSHEGIKSFAGQPLVFRKEVLGVLGLFSRVALDDRAFRSLRSFADHAAIAIANAQGFDEIRRFHMQVSGDRDRLQLLLDVNNAVVTHLDIHKLIRAIGPALHRAVPHDLIGISIYDASAKVFRLNTLSRSGELDAYTDGLIEPLEGSITGHVFTTRTPVVANSLAELKAVGKGGLHAEIEKAVRSVCMVPLVTSRGALGVLAIASAHEGAFVAASAELLAQVAAQIAPAVENALAYEEVATLKRRVTEEKLYLEREIDSVFDEIVGESDAIRQVIASIETVAPTDTAVLIVGETGTGKELVARSIHKHSTRREGTFVKLNCAAIPMGLLESELFGHEKGAFTGAVAQRVGRFELAHRGTLFLDEIGDIPAELQPKLLRVLQEHEFERLGGTRTIRVDVRVVAATNRDLAQMVAAREYRSDLYYRFNVFPIHVPPLRDRREDIPLLVHYFVARFARRLNKTIETISAGTMEALQRWTWPGNIRELENVIERSVILTRGTELHVPLTELAAADPWMTTEAESPTAPTTLEAAERDHILKALRRTRWVVGGPKGAATQLGMSRTTLQSRMKRLGIERPV